MNLLSSERIAWLRKHQRVTHGAIAVFWAVLFLVCFYRVDFISYELREIDLRFADKLARSGRTTPPNPDIVFLGIDDASQKLDAIDPSVVKDSHILTLMSQQFPWDREVYAATLDRLYNAGAKVVIFDLLLPTARASDPLLKAALDRANGHVVIGCNLVYGRDSNLTSTYDLQNATLTLPNTSLIDDPVNDPRVALVNFFLDQDGVIRSTRLSLPYLGASIGQVQSSIEIPTYCARVAELVGHPVPNAEGLRGFRYTGPPGSFQGASLYQIFVDSDWKGQFQNGAYFKDKIVMIGPKGDFMQDQHLTPFPHPMDGAEVHLNAINAILHDEFLFYTGDSFSWMVCLVALGAFIAWLLGITMQRVTIKRSLLCASLSVLFSLLYLYAGFTFFDHGIILAAAAPLGTLGFTIFSGLSGQYILEQVERARTRRFFERYVSPRVVKEILDNPARYTDSLNGRRRAITVLFSDLRGFTSMTEKADSEQLVRDLNEYLRGMNRALFQHDGILDKFIGDAVMAVWGSFQPKPEQDTRNAVLAALAMHKELEELNVIRAKRDATPLAMGVGINHGEAIVGDIGSDQQMNFTVIGDPVNVASRLEGTTKEFGVGLLISETVEAMVRPYFHLQTVDSIVVKGRVQPVMTYTVLGSKETPLPAEKIAYLEKYEEAMRLYRTQEFARARDLFEQCTRLNPLDKLPKIFAARSANYAEHPPEQPWDGSYTMKTK